ncbi:O-antigen ligase family protein [Neorhodopirellula lusitana]|uniref:O-antigen ligase family protein n=1 Tax=Neorhodopirellula lusitana TaxID=445327 RepID=UPI00384FE55B
MSPALHSARQWAVLGAASALIVWAIYQPGDSTAVEQGLSLGLTFCVLAWVTAAASTDQLATPLRFNWRNTSHWVDALPLLLAGWVFLAGWVAAGCFSAELPKIGGNLRAATNEGWWWLAAAGWWIVSRRMMARPGSRSAMTGLLISVGVLLAVHTLHQQYISLPQTLRDYEANPDQQLALAGVSAPSGSAERMIFENRLRDGGPTATFALANSLAGPLAMIAAACLTILVDSRRRLAQHVGFYSIVAAAVCLILWALLISGSRSGVCSVVVAGIGCAAVSLARPHFSIGKRLIGIAVVAGAAVMSLAAMAPNREWWSHAPATIQLRLQYWRSTLAMVWDHPWFGIGPGNFQLAYQKYRGANAHELIAEPHNFFFETLACGGWVAALMLLAFLIATLTQAAEEANSPSNPDSLSTFDSDGKQSWGPRLAVAGGGIAGIFVAWYIGITTGNVPDFEAHQFALPIAIAFAAGWLVWSPNIATEINSTRVGTVASAAGLIHLCFSSGWSIPGVAVVLVGFATMAVSAPTAAPEPTSKPMPPTPSTDTKSPFRTVTPHSRATGIAIAVTGIIALGTMWNFSIRPVAATQATLQRIDELMQRGRISTATQQLRTSLQVDPLARQPAIWLASIENRRWIASYLQSKSTTHSAAFTTAFETAAQRIGNDPSLLKAIGDMHLQRYQVAGQPEDLRQAADVFDQMIDLSPTHEAYVAQAAEIAWEQSDRGITPRVPPDDLAKRAMELSQSGGVITRFLAFQVILPAKVFGDRAASTFVTASAEDVFADRMAASPEQPKQSAGALPTER